MRLFTILIAFASIYQEAGEWFNKYVFADWDFVPFLVIFVTIDTFTGVYVNAKLKRLHSFKMRSVFEKLQQYAVGLIIIHGIASHLVDGSPNQVVHMLVPFLKGGFYVYMLVCEAISVEENLSKIGKGYLPVWLKSKLVDYKETGKVPSPDQEQPSL
ncbi:phage holin family protein [Pontibacter kalidii]|uniref:phage holin family protein n=1 Tax=Pontibacter kalidii TaxID=2592049 RepID=UPI00224F8B39|nr:phage holin family protein [Pontibacter kalidii]